MRPVFYTNCDSIVWSIGASMNFNAEGAQNIGSYNQNYGLESGYSYCNNQAGQDYYSNYQSYPRFGRPENNYGFNNQSQYGFNGFDNQYNGSDNQTTDGFNGFDNQSNGYDNQYLKQNRGFNDQSAKHYNWNTEQHSFQYSFHHSFQQQDFISTGYNFQTYEHNQTRSGTVAEVVKDDQVQGDVIHTSVLEPENLLDELELSGLNGMELCIEKSGASVEERKVDGSCVSKPLKQPFKQPRKQLRLARESAVGEEALKVIYGKSEEEFRFYAGTHTNEEQVYIAGKLRVNHKNALAQSKRRKKLDNIIIGLSKEIECIRKRKGKLTKERGDLEKLRNDWVEFLKSKQDLLEKHLEDKGIDPALLKKLKHSAPGTEREKFIEALQMLK